MRAKIYGSTTTFSDVLNFLRRFIWLHATVFAAVAVAFSETKTNGPRPRRQKVKPPPSLHTTLQKCFTPSSILENVAVSLTPKVDSSGVLSSLTLVRLSKQLTSLDNKRNNLHDVDTSTTEDLIVNDKDERLWNNGLKSAVSCLASSNWVESPKSLEAVVEGIKAASVISRVLQKCQYSNIESDNNNDNDKNGINNLWWKPLMEKINEEDNRLAAMIQPHQLSGMKWSMDCFQLSMKDGDFAHLSLPQNLQHAYEDLDLPFTIRPGFLTDNSTSAKLSSMDGHDNKNNLFSVQSFMKQVDFRVETIQTTSKRAVAERRQTAWQGDDHVAPFEYSGKSMQRMTWSPVVANVRDRLCEETSHYYDGCLLNLYPDGGSGMRYHMDPDQGVQWGFETVVVSIGATRRFAFRSTADNNKTGGGTGGGKGVRDPKPHLFVLMDGDVTEMFRDCQERFQHTVKTAELKGESAPRVSLVFKKTLGNT